MNDTSIEELRGISAMELLSVGGFAFLIGWMLVSFYWLFCDFPPAVPIEMRDFAQMFVFLGIPAGYSIQHAASKSPKFNLFALPLVIGSAICGIALPAVAFAMYSGVQVPAFVICTVNFLAGLAFSALNVAWLDVCSRLRTKHYNRFMGLAYVGGGALFVLAALAPETMQPLFSFVYVLLSVGLLNFCTTRADGNDECAPLESTADTWRFVKEIEPSFFMFGLVFALTFVYLFNSGQEAVLVGMIFILPGALVLAVMSLMHRAIGITSIQRVLTFVTVAACVATPFASGWLQLLFSCVVVGAWAMFCVANNAFIVKKSVLSRETPLFRQAPMRLAVVALGFAAGWIIAVVATDVFGAHSYPFTVIRLAVAVVLVAVIMFFYPREEHHEIDGTSPDDSERSGATTVVNVSMNEQELFEARCDAVAKLFQLSPREGDILRFLAKGRNAAYIQEKLTISPHTVKSHIYNIYRKLDIHSQQKLMDFVEDFPLEPESIEK